MAKKSLGFVELEWICPICNARNPGSQRTCQGCGSPQPPDVQFVAPGQADVVTDEEVARQATARPDIHCPYCDARNPADAKVCKQCGGDLTQGEVRTAGELVSDFSTTGPGVVECATCGTENPANLRACKSCGAPLPIAKPAATPKPQTQPASGGNSCLLIAVGAVLLLVAGVVIFGMLSGGERTTTVGTVVDNRWVRTIEVMGLRPKEYTAWLDEIPGDATLGACTDEVRGVVEEEVPNSREICGTAYAVDQGTGFAEVMQDCVYEVVEQQCKYTVNEWQPVDTITEEGTGVNPTWPTLVGRQREGDRAEEYQCIFTIDDATYVYQTRTFEEYQHCVPGSSWTLETNASGRILSAAPVE